LNADSGEPHGAAIRATVTLTLGAPKRGLLMEKAWPYVGRLEVEPDIGLVPNPPSSELLWTLGRDFSSYPPARPVQGHKGTFGHAVIIAGSVGFHGASVLAARGAMRACPGLVTVLTYGEAYLPVASQLQAAMVHTWHPGAALPDSCTAIVIGPGLAAPSLPADLKSEFLHIWHDLPCPVVADASALNWLTPGKPATKALRVITPHPGEAARLLNTTTTAIQGHRLKAVSELSRRYGHCWVVLKGFQTMIGQEFGDCFINSSGNPLLAQGGSGDVLAGFIGGLLAQPQLQTDPLTAIRYAVWQHGATADWLSSRQRHWTVDDLIAKIGNVPVGFQYPAFGFAA
jgi:ADP-dependent NAD(P)H-hydrate dehydratase / NAD(P)H-hydrate epimerase